MINYSVFAQNLKEAREKAGLKQNELAEKVGITPTTISAYEKSKIKPSLENAAAIAEELKVSLDWLCGISADEQNENFFINLLKMLETDFFNADTGKTCDLPSDRAILSTTSSIIIEFVKEYLNISNFINNKDYPDYLKEGLKKALIDNYSKYKINERGKFELNGKELDYPANVLPF